MSLAHGLGWEPGLEAMHTADIAHLRQAFVSVGGDSLPDIVDPGDILTINDQGRRNSCCGNAIDKALEWDHWLSHKRTVNLSARWSYSAAKAIDGTDPRTDAGASIRGGCRGAAEIGVVEESSLPYWGPNDPFNATLPDILRRSAGRMKLRAICDIPNVEAGLEFIGSGQGAIVMGIWWTTGLASYAGGSGPIIYDGGQRIGGHAICWAGYVTVGGERRPKIWNSHGARWGNRGTMIVVPELVDRWIRQAPFGAMGLTGMPSFAPRRIEQLKEAFVA